MNRPVSPFSRSLPLASSSQPLPSQTRAPRFAGGDDNGDVADFGASRSDDDDWADESQDYRPRFPRLQKWVAASWLSMALFAGGAFSLMAGASGAANTIPAQRATMVTNTDDLANPVEAENASVDSAAESEEKQSLNLENGEEITAEKATEYAQAGYVSAIEPGDERREYRLTVKQDDQTWKVKVTLDSQEQERIALYVNFGPAAEDPTVGLGAKQPLPTGASISPTELLNYAKAGQVLSFEKASGGVAPDGAYGNARAGGNSAISQPVALNEDQTGYTVAITDGKGRQDVSVVLSDGQASIVTTQVKANPATYHMDTPARSGADVGDLLLMMQGMGLIGGAVYTALPMYRRRKEEATPTPAMAYRGGGLGYGGESASQPERVGKSSAPAGFKRPQIKLKDVAGLSRQTKDDLQELIEVLSMSDVERAERGLELPKGALLYGPPGTGKTILSQALAHESRRYYRRISASSLKTQHLKGDGIRKIQQEFAAVRRAAASGQPLLLQIDEVDGLFGDRGKADDEDAQTLNQFLTEIDDLHEDCGNVVILYTSNHPKKLDSAAIRNERVDHKIKVPLPATVAQRMELLDYYTEQPVLRVLADDADLEAIAEKTTGFSGADFKALMNKAALRAHLNGNEDITQPDLLEAVEIIDRQRKKDGITVNGSERPETTFDDLGGLDEVIPRLEKIAKRLSQSAKSEDARQSLKKPQKPILLEGPPGTGKTEIGRAMANSAQCNFMYVNGSQFEDGIIGHGAENVRELFENARENAPTIVFIDEADTAFSKRSNGPNRNEEREATLNQLLTEINGLSPNDGVFVMAASNRPDIFDDAAKSRFESISIPKPATAMQRRQILDVQTRDINLADDVDLDALAEDTPDYSGRDFNSLIALAEEQMEAAGRTQITREDMDSAVEIFELGEKSIYPGSQKDLELVAVHEILGHGLLTMALKKRFPDIKVRTVTMEARRPRDGGGQVMGFVRPYIPDDMVYKSMASYLAQILIYAGGRASERVIVGQEQKGLDTVGGGSDYQQIERLVIQMLQSGMIPGFNPNHFAKSKQELSEDEQAVVSYIIGQAEKAAEAMLQTAEASYSDKLRQLVQRGIDAKTVRNEEAEALFTDTLAPGDWEPLYGQVDDYINDVVDTLTRHAEAKQNRFLTALQA